MAKITAYAYYGVLGHEKTAIIRSVAIQGETYDRIEIEVPDDWEVGENNCGDTLIMIPGTGTYWMIDEIFQMHKDNSLWAVWSDSKKKLEWKKA